MYTPSDPAHLSPTFSYLSLSSFFFVVNLTAGKYTILKTDHIPGALLTSLTPRVSGAVNYRKAGSCNVFSVAQPSTFGLRAVSDPSKLNKYCSFIDLVCKWSVREPMWSTTATFVNGNDLFGARYVRSLLSM